MSPLAAVLPGRAAYRLGAPIGWDAEGLKAKGNPGADALIRPPFREGGPADL